MHQTKPFGLNELREMFLTFFESKGHLRLPSYGLVPQNDPSLLLINSGMAPMKPFFTGEQEPPSSRVCTCQKCIRTGDIENIGKTARHGTYFEMLGNFSFGDYFKKEAIAYSWEFLTSPEWVGLDSDRLYPSIYVEDEDAFEIWNKEMGIASERIFRFGKKDNFWEHGSGPCGPCSEIYYDRGPQWGCESAECTVGCECDRYIEIWNNVFSQFSSDGNGNYEDLAQKNIDTGMGLERLACICQNVASLFEVDTLMKITAKVTEITGTNYGESNNKDISLRVITDHIRSATMMICDGVLPSNEGRGYVLRRLLRRAARHGKLLGINHPFLFEVCDTVIAENKMAYPELTERGDYIVRVIRVEEENFAKTIDAGIKIYNDVLAVHKAKGEMVFSGADAFKLYDTYGFPIDLTIEMAEEEGMTLDQDEFRSLMEAQRQRARKARESMGDLGWAGIEFGKDMPATEFVGYDNQTNNATLLAIVAEESLQTSIVTGVEAILVLDQSVFYAEMGGQRADSGVITTETAMFEVDDVQKNKGGKYMHYGKVLAGEFTVGDAVIASIDLDRRKAIMRAHSATHLLQKALQIVLGDHVHQSGSMVEADNLRFDFTHFSALTADELTAVDRLVNEAILEGYGIGTQEMHIDEAKAQGATALFGEKYGTQVRVVNMGGYSVELCGGTHLDNTAKIGPFRIENEFSVASGVRRIEATTGMACLDAMNKNRQMMYRVAEIMKAKPYDLMNKVESQIDEMRALRQAIEKFKAKEAAGEAERVLFGAHEVKGLKVITTIVPNADGNKLRQMGELIRDKDSTIVAVFSSVIDNKITFVASCGKLAISRGIKAGDIIRMVTAICGGKGGGKPDSAMGGGTDLLKLDDALAKVDDYVFETLGDS